MKTAWKRRFLPLILSLLLLCCLLPGLSGCADDGMAKDAYGIERPEKSIWLTESLLLPGMPPLEQLFGTGGQSGLLSEYAIENNGKLNTEGTNYLVTLCYGTPKVFDLHTYLRFVLVGADGILYDEECVEVGSTLQYGFPVESFYMQAAPDQRLTVKTSPNMQGAVVIPFTVKDGLEGTLYVYCSLDSPGEFDHYYVGGPAEANIGAATGGKEVSVDRISVGYLSASLYNGGNFADTAIIGTPTFEEGPCYMVLDLAFTAKKHNEGDLSLGCFVCIPDETGHSVTLEEAPTGKVERTLTNGFLRFDAIYSIPKVQGEAKSVRMILRLNDASVLDQGVELFLCGSEGTTLNGTAHIANALEWVAPTMDSEEDAAQQGAISVWGKVVIAIAALGLFIICYAMLREFFVEDDRNRVLFALLAFVLSAVVLFLMLTYSTWSWWVIALVEAGYILILIFLSALSAVCCSRKDREIVVSCVVFTTVPIPLILFAAWSWWTILIATLAWVVASCLLELFWGVEIAVSDGKCGIMLLSVLLNVAAFVMLTFFTAWAWWIVVLGVLGVMGLGSLLCALVGKHL